MKTYISIILLDIFCDIERITIILIWFSMPFFITDFYYWFFFKGKPDIDGNVTRDHFKPPGPPGDPRYGNENFHYTWRITPENPEAEATEAVNKKKLPSNPKAEADIFPHLPKDEKRDPDPGSVGVSLDSKNVTSLKSQGMTLGSVGMSTLIYQKLDDITSIYMNCFNIFNSYFFSTKDENLIKNSSDAIVETPVEPLVTTINTVVESSGDQILNVIGTVAGGISAGGVGLIQAGINLPKGPVIDSTINTIVESTATNPALNTAVEAIPADPLIFVVGTAIITASAIALAFWPIAPVIVPSIWKIASVAFKATTVMSIKTTTTVIATSGVVVGSINILSG